MTHPNVRDRRAMPPALAYDDAVADLPWPSQEERDALLRLPPTREAHGQAYARLPALHLLELRPPPEPRHDPPAGARIAFWNAERLKYPQPSAALLGGIGADALLLCELDLGMARSGQHHTTRDLAGALAMGYAFGAEFVELGLGDLRERRWHAGEANRAGLHGAAILAPFPLERPRMVRLEVSGAWFDGAFGERRIGGRMAVLATLRLEGGPVTLASVHFESHGDPESRAVEMRTLLEAIEAYAPGRPALIGGDFNTASAAREPLKDPPRRALLVAADPGRFLDPVRHEPLFEVARRAGYDWSACNDMRPTQRTRPDGTPAPPLGRLDWFFARGLETTAAATLAAVDAAGVAISDHEVLVVEIHPR